MGVLTATNHLGRRLQRAGVQPAFSAHHQRRWNDQELHRLSFVERQRQQRVADAVVRIRHGYSEFVWTEPDEPQAVIGSHLHKIAYPANYTKHVDGGSLLTEAYEHSGHDIQDIVLRGEYLYTANGPGGFEVFDVANINQKGFSERIVSSPVSPLGQRTRIHTSCATSLALPSTLALDPTRQHLPENEEQPIDLFYAFVYISDREEGLVISNVATLVDGNPDNNFLKESETVRFNPNGALTGATFVAAAGHRLYLTTPRGLYVIDVSDPTHPRIAGSLTNGF